MSRLKELAAMVAKKRGFDPEIASMAAMLHDLHAYKTGSYDDHAHKGAELAKEILAELKLTDDAETEMICSAIYHYSGMLRPVSLRTAGYNGHGCTAGWQESAGQSCS